MSTVEEFNWDEVEEIIKKEEKEQKSFKDDRFWKHTHDKDKDINYSVIRLMPQPGIFKDIKTPNYVEIHKQNIFIGKKGAWEAIYAENDPEQLHPSSKDTIRRINPMNDIQRILFFREGNFKMGKKPKDYTPKEVAAREESKIFRSKKRYITNMRVVVESNNQENKGKHFLYEFGGNFYKFLESKMNISEEMKKQMEELGEEQQKLYNPITGWNIKIVTNPSTKGFAYESDYNVQKQVPAFDSGKEAVEWIQENCVDLSEFTDESNYKSYEELKESATKFFQNYTPRYMAEEDLKRVVKQVLGDIYGDSEDTPTETPKETVQVTETKTEEVTETPKVTPSEKVTDSDLDDFLNQL